MAITRASFDLDGCVIPFWNRTDEIFETAYCTVGKNVPFLHYGPKRPDNVWSNTRNSYTWNFDFFQKNIYFRPNKDYEVCRSTYICPKAPQIKKLKNPLFLEIQAYGLQILNFLVGNQFHVVAKGVLTILFFYRPQKSWKIAEL